jgi:hypothetical protein
MGLIEQEIFEIRDMAKKVLEGTMTADQAATQIGFYNQVYKREQLLLSILAISAKHGVKEWKRISKKNLIGENTAIVLNNHEEPHIICDEMGGESITFRDCLNHSGKPENLENCEGCVHFKQSRDFIVNGNKQ